MMHELIDRHGKESRAGPSEVFMSWETAKFLRKMLTGCTDEEAEAWLDSLEREEE